MKRIERYCQDGNALAQVIHDLYANYDTITIASTPACEVAGYYGFGVSIDGSEFENAVFIGGHCYQMKEADERDRCKACALRDMCPGEGAASRCYIFKDQYGSFREFERYHFEKVKTY